MRQKTFVESAFPMKMTSKDNYINFPVIAKEHKDISINNAFLSYFKQKVSKNY